MGKLGFIGLGSQGAPMARRMIDAGLDVVLWARRPQTLEEFGDTPALIADSVEALAAQVDYCALCVVDDAGVTQVCDAMIPDMRAGALIVIHSTVNPELCRKLAGRAREKGIELLDAPVSGGGPAAAEGRLTVMVGGAADAEARARPVFETFARTIVHLGDVGAGQTTKLVNNTLMAANLAVAHHAIETAQALGIDALAFGKLVAASSGHSFSFDVRARMSSPTDFRHGAELLAKDVHLLGGTVGNTADYAALRDTAGRFLNAALQSPDDTLLREGQEL